jgi:ribonucleoside-diphosphate reductase alpha chain
VRQADNTFKQYKTYNFGARLWKHMYPKEDYPRYMVEATDLKIYEHIAMQEAGQRWIDASVSKTINVPEETSYEDFVDVYRLTYEAGNKGCTTYRPSPIRGSILSTLNTEENKEAASTEKDGINNHEFSRPQILHAITCKVKWPNLNSALYITLGYTSDGTPYEVFLNSKDQRYTEWMTTTTLMLSWLIRSGTPFERICEELRQIHSMDGAFAEQAYRPSLVSFIGVKLSEMYRSLHNPEQTPEDNTTTSSSGAKEALPANIRGMSCNSCGSFNTYREEGCLKCRDCGNSKCG